MHEAFIMYHFQSVRDTTLLTQRNIYFINGAFYSYLWKSDSCRHPQYYFRPLAGQRKRADLKLNQRKVYSTVQDTGMKSGKYTTIGEKAIQLSLF